MSSKVCVVTGSNKGIGYAIVKILATEHPSWVVYLTSRDEARGRDALANLALSNVRYHQLDVTDSSSASALAVHLKAEHGGLDILVNNAAIAFTRTSTASVAEQALSTCDTNYFGIVKVCEALFPLLREGARVVHVSSRVSCMAWRNISQPLKDQFLAAATEKDVSVLVQQYVDSAQAETNEADGWGQNSYGVSKIGVVFLAKVQAPELLTRGILVNSMCPGLIDTDMTNGFGVDAPEVGADTAIWLANLAPDDKTTGRFFAERTEFGMDSRMKLMWYALPIMFKITKRRFWKALGY